MLKGDVGRMISSLAEGGAAGNGAGREYELKLVGSARDIRALKTRVDRHVGDPTGWRTRTLRTTYYDTPDRALGAAGVTWRVRKVSRRFEQCVKVTGTDGILDRREWETPVPNNAPDAALLPAQAAQFIEAAQDAPLDPLFATLFQRRLRLVDQPSAFGPTAQIEVAIDKGTVEAGGRSEPIHEVEFELKRGDPRDLFNLVLAVTDGTGLRPSPVSKAKRGHRLAGGSAGLAPVFAPKPALEARTTVSESLASVFRIGLETLSANEPVAVDGADVEGVHQMRVAVRRMRTALSAFSPFIDPNRIARAKDDLKWLIDVLGPARDWDVFIDEIASPIEGPGIDAAGRAVLLDAARAERDAAYDTMRGVLVTPAYARAVLRLFAFAETRGWLSGLDQNGSLLMAPIGEVAPHVLARVHRKAVKAGRSLATLSLEDRHRLRIRIKKLRYAVEFLQALYDGESRKAYRRRLTRLQDRFGHLNDVSVAERLVASLLQTADGVADNDERRMRLRLAAGAVLGWHARGIADDEDELLREWDDFAKTRPFWPKP